MKSMERSCISNLISSIVNYEILLSNLNLQWDISKKGGKSPIRRKFQVNE